MASAQIDIEGFCHYTPSDKLVRNSFLKIVAPLPRKFQLVNLQKVHRVMRWKVYLLGDLSTEMKGVCASPAGWTRLMEEAVAFLARKTDQKDAAFACFYGLVDLKGRPLYPRSRGEIADEIDVGIWPNYQSCTCSECLPGQGSNILLPGVSLPEAPQTDTPFRAVSLDSKSLASAKYNEALESHTTPQKE